MRLFFSRNRKIFRIASMHAFSNHFCYAGTTFKMHKSAIPKHQPEDEWKLKQTNKQRIFGSDCIQRFSRRKLETCRSWCPLTSPYTAVYFSLISLWSWLFSFKMTQCPRRQLWRKTTLHALFFFLTLRYKNKRHFCVIYSVFVVKLSWFRLY